jgi:hypothetical protein
MTIKAPQFKGVYIKVADNTAPGPIGHSSTRLQIVVTNDSQGEHLKKYASIVDVLEEPRGWGADTPGEISSERTFDFVESHDGYFHQIAFNAGRNQMDKTDSSKASLVRELLQELPNLYPSIRLKVLESIDEYFGNS